MFSASFGALTCESHGHAVTTREFRDAFFTISQFSNSSSNLWFTVTHSHTKLYQFLISSLSVLAQMDIEMGKLQTITTLLSTGVHAVHI